MAYGQIRDPQKYKLENWSWGYKELPGSVEQTEMRNFCQFEFVLVNRELLFDFPPMAIEMIAVGEQSGSLEAMLFRIADAFEKEVEANIMLVTSLLEPIMILTMGLLVGFIVISILLPIFEMNQLIR